MGRIETDSVSPRCKSPIRHDLNLTTQHIKYCQANISDEMSKIAKEIKCMSLILT